MTFLCFADLTRSICIIVPLMIVGLLESPNNDGKFSHLSGQDLIEVNKAINLAVELTAKKQCDQSLSNYGISSLNDLTEKYKTTGVGINIFRGTGVNPADVVSDPINATDTTLDTSSAKTYLNDSFFGGGGETNIPMERAIVIVHESVHQFGGLRDRRFGDSNAAGSLNLTSHLIKNCAPIMKRFRFAILWSSL